MRRLLLVAFIASIAIACSTSSSVDAGACCPRGSGSCAGGGSRKNNPSCGPLTCDCLMITGVTMDSDGCPVDTYTSTYPNCGMVTKDSGSDASTDAPAEGD